MRGYVDAAFVPLDILTSPFAWNVVAAATATVAAVALSVCSDCAALRSLLTAISCDCANIRTGHPLTESSIDEHMWPCAAEDSLCQLVVAAHQYDDGPLSDTARHARKQAMVVLYMSDTARHVRKQAMVMLYM